MSYEVSLAALAASLEWIFANTPISHKLQLVKKGRCEDAGLLPPSSSNPKKPRSISLNSPTIITPLPHFSFCSACLDEASSHLQIELGPATLQPGEYGVSGGGETQERQNWF
ncbi:uncharacterized [Tachysurus ichikawai]